MDQGPYTEAREGELESEPATRSSRDAAGRHTERSAPRGRPVDPGRVSGDDDLEEIGLLEITNILLKRWKLVAGFPFMVACVTAVYSLVVSPRYTASATFVPEAESNAVNLPSGLAGIAGQLGVSIPSGLGANSPQFYADVLRSRTLRDQVLQAGFADPRTRTPGDSATLLDIFEVEGDSETERLESGREALAGRVSISVDNETNVVTVSTETRYRGLSADLSNLFVELLNQFNLETRQSKARERREFVQERVREAAEDLRAAEEELRQFLERNRLWEGAPQLRFQYERLQRQVSMKQEVVTQLQRMYEEARIQEVNDTPVITVIDTAVPPQEKSSPRRKLNVIIAAMISGVFAVFGAFGWEFLDRTRDRDDPAFSEMVSRLRGIASTIRSAASRVSPKSG